VLGTTDNTTITATQVIVQPPSTSGSNPGGQTIGYSQGTQGVNGPHHIFVNQDFQVIGADD
jgi:hypothetical protein